MITVYPAIIPRSIEQVEKELLACIGLVDIVQIDIISSTFATLSTDSQNLQWLIDSVFKRGIGAGLKFQLDLMVSAPELQIPLLREYANIVDGIIIHIGSTPNIAECITIVQGFDPRVRIGLALRPSQGLDELSPFLKEVQFVQFMGSDEIGKHGVVLDERIYSRVHEFRSANPFFPIQIDIGVNDSTALRLSNAGATALVAGSAVFGDETISISLMRERLTNFKNGQFN